MKILGLIFLLISSSLFAQDTIAINHLDKKHPTSFDQHMLYLYQGKPFTGVAVKGNGPDYESITHFENGQMHGAYVSFYPNRQVKESCNYVYGKRDGVMLYYFDNGQKMNEMTYKTGFMVDTAWSWHKNGNLKSMDVYPKEGHTVIVYDIYYENGQKHIECRTDYKKQWHKNGQLEFEAHIVNDHLDGKIKYRNEEGKVYKIEVWEDGKTISVKEKIKK